ncbi:MAG: phage terminase large subunit [Clostridia bacterium]|nr:phage terminase large subunit [Clostridia bacterium]
MTLKLGRPTEKQKLFLKAKKKHIGFGGARGGGKSFAVRMKAKLLALRYPKIKIMIIRRTYPELMNNHISFLLNELEGAAKYDRSEYEFVFFNGSRIKFGYCARDADLDRYQGEEFDCLFIDEATQLTEYQMKTLTACVRGVNGFPKRIYYTCNPGGPGHGYIKRIFIDKRYEEGENPDEYVFIRSLVTDNDALMKAQPDYADQLRALPPKLRKAWLYGEWDVLDGKFFEEFRDDPEHYADRAYTHVIAPFAIPTSWRIYRSFDWGYAKPFSCGWWAVDGDGVLYRIAEYYGCGKEPDTGVKLTPHEVFSRIRSIEREHPLLAGKTVYGVADPAVWECQTGECIADIAARHSVFFNRGDNKRIPGWMQVHYRLRFDENGYPMMYVFNTCRDFIRTFPLLSYDRNRPEDLDTSGEDHIADETRYMCMARPIAPREENAKIIGRDDPRSLYLNMTAEDIYSMPRQQKMEIYDV